MEIEVMYGEVDSISAGTTRVIASMQVPSGKVAELFSFGVIPDYNPLTGESGLENVQIAVGGSTKVGSPFQDVKFGCTWGKNCLPFGTGVDKVPRFIVDYPAIPDNITFKFKAGDYIQIVGTANDSLNAGKVRAVGLVALLDAEEAETIYGTTVSDFVKLAGGYKSSKWLYANYVDYTTVGNGSYSDIMEIELETFEHLRLTKMGVSSDYNAEHLRIYDERTNKYFPSLDNYPFVVKKPINILPYGDPTIDYQPIQSLPEDVQNFDFNNTTIKIKISDNGNASSGRLQVIGVYERG